MKNLSILLASVAIIAFTFTSCKKDYSCDCVYSMSETEYTYSFDILNATQDDAEQVCSETQESLSSYNGNCSLN
jgi:hypothetical protein